MTLSDLIKEVSPTASYAVGNPQALHSIFPAYAHKVSRENEKFGIFYTSKDIDPDRTSIHRMLVNKKILNISSDHRTQEIEKKKYYILTVKRNRKGGFDFYVNPPKTENPSAPLRELFVVWNMTKTRFRVEGEALQTTKIQIAQFGLSDVEGFHEEI